MIEVTFRRARGVGGGYSNSARDCYLKYESNEVDAFKAIACLRFRNKAVLFFFWSKGVPWFYLRRPFVEAREENAREGYGSDMRTGFDTVTLNNRSPRVRDGHGEQRSHSAGTESQPGEEGPFGPTGPSRRRFIAAAGGTIAVVSFWSLGVGAQSPTSVTAPEKIDLDHQPGSSLTETEVRDYAVGRVVVAAAPDFDDWELPGITSRLRSNQNLDAVHFLCSCIPSRMVRAYIHIDRRTKYYDVEGSMDFSLDHEIFRLARGLPVMIDNDAVFGNIE